MKYFIYAAFIGTIGAASAIAAETPSDGNFLETPPSCSILTTVSPDDAKEIARSHTTETIINFDQDTKASPNELPPPLPAAKGSAPQVDGKDKGADKKADKGCCTII